MLGVKYITVDYMVNPIGICGAPQFGWVILSDRSNVEQTAYRLQIALDKSFDKPVYDSGRVESSQSAHIKVDSLKIISSTRYHIRVKVFDFAEESGWSDAFCFTTALLENREWRGQFISAETDEDSANSKGTYVRNCFTVKPDIASALIHCTALGLYKLFINGKKVGVDELAPGWTSYRKHLCYQSYDVTEMLRDGENVIGAMLGAGWYKGVMGFNHLRNHYGDRTAFLCQLELTYTNGKKEYVATDKSWVGADSPVLFSEIYDGETYDARLEMDGWSERGFDASGWRSVTEVEFDKNVLVSQPGSRVKELDIIPVKNILVTPQGDIVIDFGQNLTGWVRFKVKGEQGAKVELNHFEVLDASGNVYLDNLRGAKQTVTYYLKGGEEEFFHPNFTFHGFRYIRVVQYPGRVKPENFTAVAVHSDMMPTGYFECSNPDLNQLHHNILWGMKGNFLDVPTDCPQRDERLGWTGDAQIFCRTASYLMNTYTFFSKWLGDVKADQTAEGGVPHVVPDIITGKSGDDWLVKQGTHSAAAWADVAVILPWTLYLMFGDTEVLERQYESMKAWISFIEANADGALWGYRLQFGDWVALDAREGSYFGATPNELTCSAYYAYSTGIFAKIAGILGRKDDCEKYTSLFNMIVDGFGKEFFTQTGRMAARTQTAHILALQFELVPERFRERTVSTLLELLKENNGHLVTGFVGTPYFCHALSRNNHTREAYELLLKEDFPSWLYQVKAGATTVWEHWDGIKPDGSMWSADMNSFNHYAYGAIGEWLFRVVAGIETSETKAGFKHSIIQPHIGGGLKYVKSGYTSVYGDIQVHWQAEDDRVELNVAVPHNTRAEIRLGWVYDVICSQGIRLVENADGTAASVGSGKYHFSYRLAGKVGE